MNIPKEILRVAKLLLSIEFDTQDAYDKYMKQHPDADPKNHSVKKQDKKTEEKKPVEKIKEKVKEVVKKHEPEKLMEKAKKKYGDKLFGGNCGQFAYGMAKYLIDKGEKNVKLGLITEETDLDGEDIKALQDEEPKIYHVFVQIGDDYYDGSGKINKDYLTKFAKDEYDDANPELWDDIDVNEDARRLISGETDWDKEWTEFYHFFEKGDKKNKEEKKEEKPEVKNEKEYSYTGNCTDVFDEDGNSQIDAFTDVSDFAYKDENAKELDKEDFEAYVKEIPPEIEKKTKKHDVKYLFYDGNTFVLYDADDDIHYFFTTQ
jgi:hypothetical protein